MAGRQTLQSKPNGTNQTPPIEAPVQPALLCPGQSTPPEVQCPDLTNEQWKDKFQLIQKQLEESERQRQHQLTLELEQQAKVAAITVIAAATGRQTTEVELTLTAQSSRFRDFAEAIRVTTEMLAPQNPPDNLLSADMSTPKPAARGSNSDDSSMQALSSIHSRVCDISGTGLGNQLSPSTRGLTSAILPNSSTDPYTGPKSGLGSTTPMSLRECYNLAMEQESLNSGENSFRYSVQIDRPFTWVDVSVDPKYPCAGWSPEAYTFWKENAEKRKSQGATQKFLMFIHMNMLDTISTMLRIQPEMLMSFSDDRLIRELDSKFNIAQETNLLLMTFSMPARPSNLSSWELHLPTLSWGNYVTKWLKELRKQAEGGKDLEKYDLTDVFIQSIQEFKLLHDHAKNLKKLPVKELIASCTDYLQEQVISEKKSSDARKQTGMQTSEAENKKEGHIKEKESNKGFSATSGAMTAKQARAFMTEAAKIAQQPPPTPSQSRGPTSQPTLPPFVISFNKLSFFDVGCEGCGKWYKNQVDKKYPYPCHGKCQYEGHPSYNAQLHSKKWKYPGYCCSWRGMDDKNIPPAILSRLQKYSSGQKRDRSHQQ
jgi:hypothetical protein